VVDELDAAEVDAAAPWVAINMRSGLHKDVFEQGNQNSNDLGYAAKCMQIGVAEVHCALAARLLISVWELAIRWVFQHLPIAL